MNQCLDIVTISRMMKEGMSALKDRQLGRSITPGPSDIETNESSPAVGGKP